MTRDVTGEARVPRGGPHGGEWTKGGAGGGKLAQARGASSKAERAKATYKPSSKAKQDIATASEQRVARMVNGENTPDNLPVDVLVRDSRGRLHGIEVKSVTDNGNNKITMHPPSLERKHAWERSNKATIHTVVVDVRTNTVFYRKGVGSFRLHTLTRVESAKHLRQIMGLDR